MSLRKDGFMLTTRITLKMLKKLDALAKKLGVSRSVVVRSALDRGIAVLESEASGDGG